MPVCPNTARTSQLPAEYAHCVQQLHKKLQQEENLTVSADGWTDRVKRAILGVVVVLGDGSKALLRSVEHSAEDHTGAGVLLHCALEKLPGVGGWSSWGGCLTGPLCASHCVVCVCAGDNLAALIKVLQDYDIAQRVAMLTTDNAAAMVRARNIVVATLGMQHIVPFRYLQLPGVSVVQQQQQEPLQHQCSRQRGLSCWPALLLSCWR